MSTQLPAGGSAPVRGAARRASQGGEVGRATPSHADEDDRRSIGTADSAAFDDFEVASLEYDVLGSLLLEAAKEDAASLAAATAAAAASAMPRGRRPTRTSDAATTASPAASTAPTSTTSATGTPPSIHQEVVALVSAVTDTQLRLDALLSTTASSMVALDARGGVLAAGGLGTAPVVGTLEYPDEAEGRHARSRYLLTAPETRLSLEAAVAQAASLQEHAGILRDSIFPPVDVDEEEDSALASSSRLGRRLPLAVEELAAVASLASSGLPVQELAKRAGEGEFYRLRCDTAALPVGGNSGTAASSSSGNGGEGGSKPDSALGLRPPSFAGPSSGEASGASASPLAVAVEYGAINPSPQQQQQQQKRDFVSALCAALGSQEPSLAGPAAADTAAALAHQVVALTSHAATLSTAQAVASGLVCHPALAVATPAVASNGAPAVEAAAYTGDHTGVHGCGVVTATPFLFSIEPTPAAATAAAKAREPLPPPLPLLALLWHDFTVSPPEEEGGAPQLGLTGSWLDVELFSSPAPDAGLSELVAAVEAAAASAMAAHLRGVGALPPLPPPAPAEPAFEDATDGSATATVASVLDNDGYYPLAYASFTRPRSCTFSVGEEAALVSSLDALGGQALGASAWRRGLPAEDDEEGIAGLTASAAMPTLCTDLFAWGRGAHGVLGSGAARDAPGPVPVRLPREIGVWRVRQVSASWYHTVALTDAGAVFTWGSGADGALGHGDTASSALPKMVDFFGLMHPLTVVAVAAGSDALGCHTLAVAVGKMVAEEEELAAAGARANLAAAAAAARRRGGRAAAEDAAAAELQVALETGCKVAHLGRVFAWGVGSALGNGSLNNKALPCLVSGRGSDLYAPAHGGVRAVAAGGGFSLALTRSGALYSWGKWANGRLGLGQPGATAADLGTAGQLTGGERKRTPRYVLTPARVVRGLEWTRHHEQALPEDADVQQRAGVLAGAPNAAGPRTLPLRAIACGEAHALAIDAYGLLWGWGRGTAGQIGIGYDGDVLSPCQIPVFEADAHVPKAVRRWRGGGDGAEAEEAGYPVPVRFIRVAAGVSHSLAVAADGSVYSWGGFGSNALGHADQLYQGLAEEAAAAVAAAVDGSQQLTVDMVARLHAAKNRQLLALMADGGAAAAASALTLAALPWLWPRRLSVFGPSQAGGEAVRVVQVSAGAAHSVAVTASGHLYVWGEALASSSSNGASDASSASRPYSAVPTLFGAGVDAATGDVYEAQAASDCVIHAAAGGWHTVVVGVGGEVGRDLVRLLPVSTAAIVGRLAAGAEAAEDGAVPSSLTLRTDIAAVKSCDAVLVVGTRERYPCHRAVLAARSPVFAARLEALPYRPRRPVRLDAPDLSAEVALLLLEYCYSGDIAVPPPAGSPLMRELLEAALAYGVARLEALCRAQLDSPIAFWMRQLMAGRVEDREGGGSSAEGAAAMPNTSALEALVAPRTAQGTLEQAHDVLHRADTSLLPSMLQLLLQPSFYDVVFVAGGYRLPAHSYVLAARASYFRTLFWGAAALADEEEGEAAFDPLFDAEATMRVLGTGQLLDDDGAPAEVAVPDAPLTMLRVLHFLYCGTLPRLPSCAEEGNDVSLLPGLPVFLEPHVPRDEEEEEGAGEGEEAAPAAPATAAPSKPRPTATLEVPDEPITLKRRRGSVSSVGSAASSLPSRPASDAAPVPLPPSWSPSTQLLLDLAAAERYNLSAMKTALESVVALSPATAPRVLEAADALGASRLRAAAVTHLVLHLDEAVATPAYKAMAARSPHLLAEVLAAIRSHRDTFYGVVDVLDEAALTPPAVVAAGAAAAALKKEEEDGDSASALFKEEKAFPWKIFLGLAASVAAFRALSEYNTALTPLVPAVNIVIVALSLIVGIRGGLSGTEK